MTTPPAIFVIFFILPFFLGLLVIPLPPFSIHAFLILFVSANRKFAFKPFEPTLLM
ncbi:hypothetical protein BDV40DRAFT_257083 [Aspergillus tamarii]|uniref:Uncharacterized protein n=1 Tax=Aspergillus tamarii TaxID=41984 RepID=A0A5N6V518_ASPTM|nr:hypothetical protein BDV40DRAFT_257083 [Aspergillus tamarii]